MASSWSGPDRTGSSGPTTQSPTFTGQAFREALTSLPAKEFALIAGEAKPIQYHSSWLTKAITSATAAKLLTRLCSNGPDRIAGPLRGLLRDASHGMAFVVATSSVKEFTLAHWLVGGDDGGQLFVRVFDGAANGRENIAGDVLASGTTMPWNRPAKGWKAGAVMADASLNRRQTIRVGAGVALAQVGIVSSHGRIELNGLRLFGLPERAPAVLYACPSVQNGTSSLALETTWDLPRLTAGKTVNIDVTVTGARRGDFADVSLDTSRIAFVLDCHIWSNKSVRVTARNGSASTVISRLRPCRCRRRKDGCHDQHAAVWRWQIQTNELTKTSHGPNWRTPGRLACSGSASVGSTALGAW